MEWLTGIIMKLGERAWPKGQKRDRFRTAKFAAMCNFHTVSVATPRKGINPRNTFPLGLQTFTHALIQAQLSIETRTWSSILLPTRVHVRFTEWLMTRRSGPSHPSYRLANAFTCSPPHQRLTTTRNVPSYAFSFGTPARWFAFPVRKQRPHDQPPATSYLNN